MSSFFLDFMLWFPQPPPQTLTPREHHSIKSRKLDIIGNCGPWSTNSSLPHPRGSKSVCGPFPRACNWFLLFVKLLGSANTCTDLPTTNQRAERSGANRRNWVAGTFRWSLRFESSTSGDLHRDSNFSVHHIIFLLFARNLSSCRTHTAFKHNKTASSNEYKPNAMIFFTTFNALTWAGSKQMMQRKHVFFLELWCNALPKLTWCKLKLTWPSQTIYAGSSRNLSFWSSHTRTENI